MQSEPGFVRAWEFSKRLIEDGHEVTVIRGAPTAEKLVEAGVHIHSVKAPYENEMNFRRRILAFAQFAISATVCAVRSRPQLVVASSTPLTVAVPALAACVIHRAKFVFEVRDLWPKVPVELGLVTNPVVIWLARRFEKFAYRRAAVVVALSPDMADGVLEADPSANVEVVPNGCDMDEFDAIVPDRSRIWNLSNVPEGAKHVLYAGGFGYMYDLPWCIDLAAKLAEKNVYFTFIGRGSESANLIEQAKAAGIYRDGMFPGRLPKSEVIGYLKVADAVLSPLRDEPSLEACSLNKVFDAMAARRPLLLNHGGWLAEEVVGASAGWRISRNIDSAATLVQEVLEDPNSLERAGNANRSLGESKFDRDGQYVKFRNALMGQEQ